MSREETAQRLKKKFLDKDLKEEVVIVLTALSADLPEDKVERYMTTDLNADQLIEMMVAIMDGLPETTLETFAEGKTPADSMRALRLMSRGDYMLQMMTEQILDLKEVIEKVATNCTGQDKLSKSIRELKSEITSVRGCVESIEEKLKGGQVSMADEKKADSKAAKNGAVSATAAGVKAEKVENDPKAFTARMEGYQRQMAYPSAKEAEGAAGDVSKPMDYVTKDGVVISSEPVPATNKRSILGIFRRTNEDRVGVVASETDKRKAINKIVALGLEEDKLKALSVGARAGVDPETLKKFAQRGASASQIYNYINIFGALFIEGFKPVAATAC